MENYNLKLFSSFEVDFDFDFDSRAIDDWMHDYWSVNSGSIAVGYVCMNADNYYCYFYECFLSLIHSMGIFPVFQMWSVEYFSNWKGIFLHDSLHFFV